MAPRRISPNREVLVRVARRIEPLLGEWCSWAGTSPSCSPRIQPPCGFGPRTTWTWWCGPPRAGEYQRIGERLMALGMTQDTREGAPTCRWLTPEGYVLDVMPVEEKILGFSNPWYGSALDTATEYRLERRLTIRVATAPAFLATKWAAFASRGKDDLLGSRDLEDVITLVAGRGELVAEVVTAPADLRQYVAASTREFLADVFAEHAVEGALPDARILPGLVEQVTARLRRIAELR